jgi:hypothetical protein
MTFPFGSGKETMKKNITILMFLFAALALFTVPANAAKQFNDTTEINLSVFVPCAVGGPEKLWT